MIIDFRFFSLMHGRLFAKHVVHWQSLNKNWWPMCDHQMERENWQINTYASTQGTYTSTVTVTVTSTTTKIAATATATPAIRTCASAKQALTNTHTQHIHSGTLTLKRKQLYSYCWPYLSSCFKVRAAASGCERLYVFLMFFSMCAHCAIGMYTFHVCR